jgi:hypothetical protein
MNSDSLEQLWQQQPLPTAQAYRKLQDRSWELRQGVDRRDGLGAIMFAASGSLLVGVIGVVTGDADWRHWVLLICGAAWLSWVGRAKWERRRLRQSIGEDLLREIDLGLLRLSQNLTFNRRMSWVVPPLMCVAGIRSFWHQMSTDRVVSVSDWYCSVVYLLLWLALIGWSIWCSRERRRETEKQISELTELRASLLALGNSDAAD